MVSVQPYVNKFQVLTMYCSGVQPKFTAYYFLELGFYAVLRGEAVNQKFHSTSWSYLEDLNHKVEPLKSEKSPSELWYWFADHGRSFDLESEEQQLNSFRY